MSVERGGEGGDQLEQVLFSSLEGTAAPQLSNLPSVKAGKPFILPYFSVKQTMGGFLFVCLTETASSLRLSFFVTYFYFVQEFQDLLSNLEGYTHLLFLQGAGSSLTVQSYMACGGTVFCYRKFWFVLLISLPF